MKTQRLDFDLDFMDLTTEEQKETEKDLTMS